MPEAPEQQVESVSGVTLAVAGDGFTVTATTSGIGGYAALGLVFDWGDGYADTAYANTASHVYAKAGTKRVVASCNGYRVENTIATTADTPATKSVATVPGYTPPAAPPATTGASTGAPGTWTPAGALPKANLAAMAAVVASPATAWAAGQFMQTTDLVSCHWSGTAWVAGPA